MAAVALAQTGIRRHQALRAGGRHHREPHSRARRHGVAEHAGFHCRTRPVRFGCAPMCPRPSSAISGSGWPRQSAPTAIPDRVYHGWVGYLAPDLGIHAEDGRDARAARRIGLSAQGLCVRWADRVAARHARDRPYRFELRRRVRSRLAAGQQMPPVDYTAPALLLQDVRHSFRSGKRVITALAGISAIARRAAP